MPLYFITGNKHKFKEFKAVLPEIKHLQMDLPEIQAESAREVMEEKLREARKRRSGEFLVEDTGLYLECMNGFPGPYIKWMLQAINSERLAEMVEKLDDNKAKAKTLIGYSDASGNIHFFEGVTKGKIVHPRTESEFDWDLIFQPEGYEKTYAEMTTLEKHEVSQRGKALEKLTEFLDKRQ